jgi:hypothetical protein
VREFVFIFDLEGVLCDNTHRLDFIKSGDWEAYHNACGGDKPYPEMVDFLRQMWGMPSDAVVSTARNERYIQETEEWLRVHGLPIYKCYMRDRLDTFQGARKEVEVKRDNLHFIQADYPTATLIAFEDRDDCVDMYRTAGIQCWQVRGGVLG